jgi:hypothetical protein
MSLCLLASLLPGCGGGDSRPGFAPASSGETTESGVTGAGGGSDEGAGPGRPGDGGTMAGSDAGAAVDLQDDELVMVDVVAAEGAMIETRDGFARLEIPPGSLAEDVTLTLSRVFDAVYGLPGFVVSIEPTGLELDPAATLWIRSPPDDPPSDWVELGLSGYEPQAPPTWRFTQPSRADGAYRRAKVPQTASEIALDWHPATVETGCGVLPSDLTPCGGELRGDWLLLGHCYEQLNYYLAEHWDGSSCGLRPGSHAWPIRTDTRFTEERFQRSATAAVIPLLQGFDPNCGTSRFSCEETAALLLESPGACSGADRCTCEYVFPAALVAVDAPYSRQGTTVTIDGTTYDYCVDGELLRIVDRSDPDQPFIAVYRRE